MFLWGPSSMYNWILPAICWVEEVIDPRKERLEEIFVDVLFWRR